MNAEISAYEIRPAQCVISDKAAFLSNIQEIARKFDVRIVCFNADLLAGRRHAEAAVRHAVRSFEAGKNISNTLEMEALLYAAGSRQCSVALSVGIHSGENRLWICCYPFSEEVWDALRPVLPWGGGDAWEDINDKKRERLIQFFGITPDELGSLEKADRITDLVLERVAFLDVIR